MGAFKIFLFLFLSCYTYTTVTAQNETGFVSSIDPKVFQREQNASHFRFYWQDIVAGDNAASFDIISSLPDYNKTSVFGLVKIIDNPLTLGPQLSSKLVGRAQGIYASISQTVLNFLMIMNFALFEGKKNVANNKVREMPVIGGSGVFRFAKGYAEASTYSSDPNTGDATIEYNVYVSHYI
ncbi:disease resistance-responsive, dirigent domain protein [Medicago truncatula]|uniref:Dirigent protein n=1 Tax=Medicago truncatula TaxID=3880 RepID=A0A072UHF8_MEDTR|nr:disease resistance-responsive, dirigent domain protein [Medicago truncatula]